ncbi:MAG: helix-turn-helix domain-containing protein [Chromatiaceae bacterium]|jgi:AraC family ethanolamine operon transcriptional activator
MIFAQPAPTIAVRSLDSFDPAGIEESVKGSHLEHVQLSSGRFRGLLLRSEYRDMQLDFGRYNLPLHARGTMPTQQLTLGFALKSDTHAMLNGESVDGSTLVWFDEGSEIDYRMAPRSEWLAIQVDRTDIERFGVEPPNVHTRCIPVAQHHRWQLGQHLNLAVQALLEIDSAKAALVADVDAYIGQLYAGMLDDFCAILQSVQPQRIPNSLERQTRLAREAVGYIDANIDSTLRIGLMCTELGTTFKSLERSFLRLYGVTPKRYVDLARLAKARRNLIASRGSEFTIADVATGCGINHLGRFAQRYKALYGELPSETLQVPCPANARARRCS